MVHYFSYSSFLLLFFHPILFHISPISLFYSTFFSLHSLSLSIDLPPCLLLIYSLPLYLPPTFPLLLTFYLLLLSLATLLLLLLLSRPPYLVTFVFINPHAYLAFPYHTLPNLTFPYHTIPCLTIPNLILLHLQARYLVDHDPSLPLWQVSKYYYNPYFKTFHTFLEDDVRFLMALYALFDYFCCGFEVNQHYAAYFIHSFFFNLVFFELCFSFDLFFDPFFSIFAIAFVFAFFAFSSYLLSYFRCWYYLLSLICKDFIVFSFTFYLYPFLQH